MRACGNDAEQRHAGVRASTEVRLQCRHDAGCRCGDHHFAARLGLGELLLHGGDLALNLCQIRVSLEREPVQFFAQSQRITLQGEPASLQVAEFRVLVDASLLGPLHRLIGDESLTTKLPFARLGCGRERRARALQRDVALELGQLCAHRGQTRAEGARLHGLLLHSTRHGVLQAGTAIGEQARDLELRCATGGALHFRRQDEQRITDGHRGPFAYLDGSDDAGLRCKDLHQAFLRDQPPADVRRSRIGSEPEQRHECRCSGRTDGRQDGLRYPGHEQHRAEPLRTSLGQRLFPEEGRVTHGAQPA